MRLWKITQFAGLLDMFVHSILCASMALVSPIRLLRFVSTDLSGCRGHVTRRSLFADGAIIQSNE